MPHCSAFSLRAVLLASWLLSESFGWSAERQELKLEHPQPWQIIQRTGNAPRAGFADVVVRATATAELEDAKWEYRVVAHDDVAAPRGRWTHLEASWRETHFEGKARIAAGGWFRLEIRCRRGEDTVAAGEVEPIGVGEVFIVAGQSYATNCNDKQFQVTDPQQRVAAFNSATGTWGVAHDPQPAPDGSDGGSIWPPMGDALVKQLRVPIGFANVAVGGTSSAQWLPEGTLHPRLVTAGQALGRFRAVLWQQGESDVIAKTSREQYVANLARIHESAVKGWGFDPPWLLAKSTLHPTVYNDPDGEGRIRGAIDELVKTHGFVAGPNTDTLAGENRGGPQSRRHFSAVGQQRAADMWLAAIRHAAIPETASNTLLQVGVAETDITPPRGFPMAGYYHERLAEGTIDPLKAKAIVFRDNESQAAIVVCDLIGIATDLSREVRRLAAEQTGIPASNIVIAATHSHTAPDYMKELYLKLGNEPQEPLRAAYIEKLIGGPVEAIRQAQAAAQPVLLEAGAARQETPVSFNRRFVMCDGSVRTWMNFDSPEVVRSAGPIDPEIGLLAIRDQQGEPLGILSNFALHLDTVGGMQWSADYPYFIEQTLKQATRPDLISIFGTGCCGDINHSNPRRRERNKADFIGRSIGESITRQLSELRPLEEAHLVVKSRVTQLPLEEVSQAEVARAIQILDMARQKGKVDFFDHVTAYKALILDQFLHREPYAKTAEHITWGLSRALAGVGDTLPAEVTVITLGSEVAIVCLPGEVFVELGLAIKQASPFPTTLILELSNCVETIYVPHRAAYAGGSYEVTNSTLQPGSGEVLVETAISLLREAATERRVAGKR